jgi:hypothetical protein
MAIQVWDLDGNICHIDVTELPSIEAGLYSLTEPDKDEDKPKRGRKPKAVSDENEA